MMTGSPALFRFHSASPQKNGSGGALFLKICGNILNVKKTDTLRE